MQGIIHNFQRGNGCGHQHHRLLGCIDARRRGQQGVDTSGTVDGEVPQRDQTRVVRQTWDQAMGQNLGLDLKMLG